MQFLTEGIVGLQKSAAIGGQYSTAAMLAACCGIQQFETQCIFGIPNDRPCLGIRHFHLCRRCAQGMKPLHTVQQLGNAGTKAFGIGKQAAG